LKTSPRELNHESYMIGIYEPRTRPGKYNMWKFD